MVKKMNKWKVSFFTLIAIIILAIIAVFVLVFSGDNDLEKSVSKVAKGNRIEVTTTPKEFESMANTLIADATKGSVFQAQLAIDEDVILKSNVTVLGVTVPVTLDFDPKIDKYGNLVLYQKDVKVGNLDLPAPTALKLVKDSGQLPDWMTIQPKEKTAHINLTSINIPIGSMGEANMEAKSFDLENKKIVLDIIIPEK